MIPSLQDLFNILPPVIIGAGILIALTLEMFVKPAKKIIPHFAFLVFLFTAYYSLMTMDKETYSLNTLMSGGGLTNILYFIFTFGSAIVVLISYDFIRKKDIVSSEYYILLMSAVLGMMIMASAKDFLMVFLGLEQMSVCFYILAGINRRNLLSNEASLKYFLLGAFATGFIVYGIAFIYGASGSLSYLVITNAIVTGQNITFLTIGLLLFIIGFSFKIAAFPFHMWVPDVYQGAPTTVSAFMSTTGKTAAFAVLIALLLPLFTVGNYQIFGPVLSLLAALSMIYGSIVAIAQKDIKRMLAYSSIAHAGYMLIGIAAGIPAGSAGVIYYLLAYTFMNIGAFGIVAYLEGVEETNLHIEDYAGLANQKPVLAALLSLFMFALAGIPPLAGFFGKYYVFVAAIKGGLVWLALVGIVSSAISVYFYLRLVVYMYFRENSKTITVFDSSYSMLGIIIAALLVIIVGVFPNTVVELITHFIS